VGCPNPAFAGLELQFFQVSLPIEYRRGRLDTPVDKTNSVSDLRAMIGG
jgi:hypothetical protein